MEDLMKKNKVITVHTKDKFTYRGRIKHLGTMCFAFYEYKKGKDVLLFYENVSSIELDSEDDRHDTNNTKSNLQFS